MNQANSAFPKSGGRAVRFFGLYGAVDVLAQLGELAAQLARPSGRSAWRADLAVLPRALRWALPWAVLGRVSRDANPSRWLERQARERGDLVAVADPEQQLTFSQLCQRSLAAAGELARRGAVPGERVALLLPTSVELVVALCGCWAHGCVPCPLEPTTPASLLREILSRLEPAWCIAGSKVLFFGLIEPARCIGVEALKSSPSIGVEGSMGHARGAVAAWRPIPAQDTALILPTSGTEGQAKLCRITAGRLALSGHAFGGLALQCCQGDVIYCPLPLHHATAITVALMPALVHGVTLHLGGQFSVSRFWSELARIQATQLIYVGDLLRYVSAAPPSGEAPAYRLRTLVGNGLDETTYRKVSQRFAACRIVEFYGATEAPSVLLNFAGRPGSIGRVPLRRLSRFVVMRIEDDTTGGANWDPRCAAGQVGELLIRIPQRKRWWLGDFEGYLEPRDEARAVVKDVLARGDRYYRTGDLVRFDQDDYFYFVDRMGDVWRSKGHNVSTVWLAATLADTPGVADVCVAPVALDDSPRRFGLAVVVTSSRDALKRLEQKIRDLPSYARPQWVQLVADIERTASFKLSKAPWRRGPWVPRFDDGPVYLWRDGLRPIAGDDWLSARHELIGDSSS